MPANGVTGPSGLPVSGFGEGGSVARNNFGFEKRQRELSKERKKEEKRQRKLERQNAEQDAPAAPGSPEEDPEADGNPPTAYPRG